jgi:hypothetical protein
VSRFVEDGCFIDAWSACPAGSEPMFKPLDPRLVCNKELTRWDGPPAHIWREADYAYGLIPPLKKVPMRRLVFRWCDADYIVYVEHGESEALGALALLALAAKAAWWCALILQRERIYANMARDRIEIERLCAEARARLRS